MSLIPRRRRGKRGDHAFALVASGLLALPGSWPIGVAADISEAAGIERGVELGMEPGIERGVDPEFEPGAEHGIERAEAAIVLASGVYALVKAYDYPYYIGAEYLARPVTRWSLTPSAALSFGRDGIVFLRVGLERDFRWGTKWFVTPSLAGGYFINGDYIGVNDTLEFQSGIAVSRRSQSGLRWGIAGYHVSNAGLQSPNNGTEAVVLFLRMPIQGKGSL